jgi:hypothetical protein
MTDVPSGLLPEGLSIALVVLFSLALGALALGAIWKTLRERRLAREAESYVSPSVLTPGPALLRGIVRTSEGGPPIRVQITERGAQWRTKHRQAAGGYWRHRWWETGRTVTARPFEVVLGSGVRVQVLASDDVWLIAPLTEYGPYAIDRRNMEATLREGTEVWIEGTLVRATTSVTRPYRGRDETWSIRASPSARLIVSMVAPALRHGRRAVYWQRMSVVAGFAFLVAQATFAAGFWPLVIHGARCETEIVGLGERTTHTRSGRVTVHSVHAEVVSSQGERVPVGTRVSRDVPEAVWRSLATGDHVSFVVSSIDPRFCVIGDHTGVSRLGALGLLTLALVGVWLLRVTHRRSLEWYDQRRVLDEGPGPL